MVDIVDMLVRHESERFKPYLDCCGKFWRDCTCSTKGTLTIAVGRNLDEGISRDESRAMLAHDIQQSDNECLHAFPWYADLDEARQAVMVNLCFNMGLTKLLKFPKLLRAMELGNYESAANELLDSLWAKQVGTSRSSELVGMIRRGSNV